MAVGDIMLDLTSVGGTNTIHMVTEYSGDVTVMMIVYIENQETACTVEIPLDANDGDIFIPFSAFAAKSGGLCDLTSVSSLELSGDLGGNSEFLLTDFGVTWRERPVPQSIDDFGDSSDVLTCNGGYTVSQANPQLNVLGSERDVILSLTQGDSAHCEVSGNIWDIHSGVGVAGEAICQYDGPDGTTDLSPRGLGSVDLTQSFGSGFLVEMVCNQITVVIVRVTDTHGAAVMCAGVSLASTDPLETIIPFSSCQPGNLDFTEVGSIELAVELQESGHVRVYNFGLSRLPVTPSPSPSASRGGMSASPSPTRTRTPSRTSHPTNSPHVTPTPMPSPSAADPTHPVVIDLFTAATSDGSLYLPMDAPPAISTGSITLTTGVLGSERDVEITVEQGYSLSTVVFGEQENFFVEMPADCSGNAYLQYDGPDLSNSLDPTGLGGVDFTLGGAAYISFLVESSTTTVLTCDVYDMAGGLTTYSDEIRSGGGVYYVPFGVFHGDLDWTNVGAVQFTIALKANIMVSISQISTAVV